MSAAGCPIALAAGRVCARRCGRSLLLLVVLASSCGRPPADPDLALHRARNALALARPDWARFYFAQDLALHPDRTESLRGLGLASSSGHEASLSRAVTALEAYLERVPTDDAVRLHLAGVRLEMGDREAAREVAETASPSGERHLLLARIELEIDPAAAREHALAAAELLPDPFAPHLEAARAHARLGEHRQAALQAAAAARLDPLRAEVHYLQAQLLQRSGEERQAAASFSLYEAVRSLPAADSGSPLSPWEELEHLRELGAELGSEPLPLALRITRLLFATGDLEAATVRLADLLDDPRSDTEAVLDLAATASAAGAIETARELYRRVLVREPDHLGARVQLAQLAAANGDDAHARQLCAEGLAEDPHYAPLHFVDGQLRLRLGEEEAAAEALERAVELAPWQTDFRLRLADLYLAQGRRGDAERLLAAAPEPDPAVAAYRQRHAV